MQSHTSDSTTGHTYRLGYRGDIEGLRAVAILLVVAAHARVPWLAGGFVGVDVFFVLSGYLITGLLVQEIRSTGTVALARFYARRFRRLLPALLLMLVVCSLFAAMLLVPGDQPAQAIAAATAAMWLSNFHFAFSNIGYFSAGADTNLYLHTWSLGVEEQFYLVWPALLMVAAGARTVAADALESARFRIVMLVAFGVSLAACVALTPSMPQLMFYMMPSRAWQFALGALVFLYLGSPTIRANGFAGRYARFLRWAGWSGLILIVASAAWLNPDMLYPGAWALLPAIGAALVLAAGAHASGSGAGRLLSLRLMQAIGRVSYAWYLWHWPVLLLGATVSNMESGAVRFALVLLSLALAMVSYRFVETPIRQNRRIVSRPVVAVLSALALMVLANAMALRWYDAAMTRMTDPAQLRYLQARSETPLIYRMGCDDWYHSADVRICAFGPKDAGHTAVAMGDSIGLQWFPALAAAFDRPGWRLLVVTKSSCPMVDEPIFYPRIGRQYTECGEWRKDALARVAEIAPDLVILGSSYTYDFTQAQWIEGTVRVLHALADAGRIRILRSTPVLPFDGPACLAPRSWLYSLLAGDDACIAPARDAQADAVFRWLQTAAARVPNATVLDMTDVVCPEGWCHAEQDDLVVFRDQQHLNAGFARSLGPVIAARLGLGAPRSQPAK